MIVESPPKRSLNGAPEQTEHTMTFHTEYLKFHTRKHREYIHITPQVEAIVKKSGVKEGMVLVSAMHITAGFTSTIMNLG